MMLAQALQPSDTVIVGGEVAAVVVALVTLWWAAQYAKPKRFHNTYGQVDTTRKGERRLDVVEGQVGVAKICNPGRRSTDRCPWCPGDERCERVAKPNRTAAMVERDAELIQLLTDKTRRHEMRGCVVVVEDHFAVLNVTRALLDQAGIKNRGAQSIAEALPVRDDDDVLVADWNLLDGTALELVSAFRAAHPDTPIILMSAMDQVPDSLPNDAVWLTKPFDPDKFVELVRRARARWV